MASTLELLDAIDAQDEENVCIVDAVNRTIFVPESLRLLGVESDEKAEIRRFRCPKIVGNNIDLTALILFINFENAGGQKGAYRIKDVEEEGDGTNITFSWELERKVTAYQGTPKFSLCAQRVKSGDDGTLEQEWNTTFNEECEVLEGLEVQESIEEEETAALTQIWQKIDELELAIGQGGSSGGIKEETDPTVPSWAKEPTKPTYTASEVGADVSGTAETKVTEHNVDDEAHNDIRLLVQGLTQKLNALADSDDDTLDQLSEIIAYIKNNKSLIDGITTSKVNVSDIINNLTTNVSNKPLSAAQGVVLKSLIDGITIPETLPNPQKLKFIGAVTAEYDGSTEQTVNIPESTGGDSYTLPIMSDTQLGGGKAVSKTDEDVPVAVDSKTGQLFVPTYPENSGTVDPEQIKQAVNGYLEENPVSGMTAEQEQQLNQNSKEIEKLKKIVEALQDSLKTWGNIVVSESNISINEGMSSTFSVSLDKKPSEDQSVMIATDGKYITVYPNELTFTPDNYSEPKIVTVQSEENSEETGDINSIVRVSSKDKTIEISINIKDNDASIDWYTVKIDDVDKITSTNCLVSSYNGNEENIFIPSDFDGYNVQMNVAVNKSFDKNNVIKNIKFDDGVTGNFQNGNFMKKLISVYGIGKLSIFNLSGSESLQKVTITSDNLNCNQLSLNSKTLVNVYGLNHLVNLEQCERSFSGCAIESIDSFPPNLKNSKIMFWNCTNLSKVPDISMNLEEWNNMFLGCNSLSELSISAMNGCGIDIIGYNVSNGTGWNGGKFTFKFKYNSDIYKSFRNMICDSVGSSEKLFYELLDDVSITDIIMWGDSMTKSGNKTMGNMPEQLASMVSNNIMIWNYGYSGNTIQSCASRFNNHEEKWDKVSVIWLGTNNPTLSGEEMVSLIKSNFIEKLTTDKYIIVGLLTTNYSDEKNQTFTDCFGEHFLDIRKYFIENMWEISKLSPTSQDNTDISNDLIPSSFRVDQTHLNPTGGKIVATAIKEKLISLGYINQQQQ